MTEKGYLFNTGGVGDGASKYTEVDWAVITKVTASCQNTEGVSPSYGNLLAPSVTGANTVQIATGGAIVDGRPYASTAAVNVTIPSAVGAGNHRYDRIVLRADWTTKTVRITRIAGVDAGSPAIPAMTQTPGNVYDIMLALAYVDTAGAVSLADQRTFAMPVVKRQGGDPTDWNIGGVTGYDGGMRIQVGSKEITIAPNTTQSSTIITYPIAYKAKPIVFAFMNDYTAGFPSANMSLTTEAIDETSAYVNILCSLRPIGIPVRVVWLAIGPA